MRLRDFLERKRRNRNCYWPRKRCWSRISKFTWQICSRCRGPRWKGRSNRIQRLRRWKPRWVCRCQSGLMNQITLTGSHQAETHPGPKPRALRNKRPALQILLKWRVARGWRRDRRNRWTYQSAERNNLMICRSAALRRTSVRTWWRLEPKARRVHRRPRGVHKSLINRLGRRRAVKCRRSKSTQERLLESTRSTPKKRLPRVARQQTDFPL